MLSIVLPSYNCSDILRKQLPPFTDYLRSLSDNFEIIIVDDGSADHEQTAAVAAEMGCTFLRNEKNMGKGAAVRKGMLAAKGEYRIFTDADIPFEYEAIERIWSYLARRNFDLAIGDRTLNDSTYFTEISAKRVMGSNLFSFVVGRFITTGLFDTQCGLKGFSARAAEDIFSHCRINSFAFDVEVLYIALKRNYDLKRLPVQLRSVEGKSVNLLKHAPRMLYDLWRIRWSDHKGLYREK